MKTEVDWIIEGLIILLQNLKIVLGNFLGTEETSGMNRNFRGKFSKNLFKNHWAKFPEKIEDEIPLKDEVFLKDP